MFDHPEKMLFASFHFRLIACLPACLLSAAAWEFALRCCTVTERSPHFVMVTLTLEGPAAGMLPLAAGAADALPPSTAGSHEYGGGIAVQRRLQCILDGFRSADIAAGRERQDQQVCADRIEVVRRVTCRSWCSTFRLPVAQESSGRYCRVAGTGGCRHGGSAHCSERGAADI